jgi:hypothetical protein
VIVRSDESGTGLREAVQVLFGCVHNAGRSQMAAALLAQEAAGRILGVDAIRPIRDAIRDRVRALAADLIPAAAPIFALAGRGARAPGATRFPGGTAPGQGPQR